MSTTRDDRYADGSACDPDLRVGHKRVKPPDTPFLTLLRVERLLDQIRHSPVPRTLRHRATIISGQMFLAR